MFVKAMSFTDGSGALNDCTAASNGQQFEYPVLNKTVMKSSRGAYRG
jgi:hypothetical protein